MTAIPIQKAATAVSLVFPAVGVLGFVPGIKSRSSTTSSTCCSASSVSPWHGQPLARSYLIGGGAVYVALWIYGLVIDQTSSANVVPLNTADNWLHLVLGIGMIGLGIAFSRSVPHTSTPRA
ncbi:DUF4383 domain-containing protein [Kribbella caucasensis]|nr:DUF4383 domain-containing protein [Kribbella sp. VKM Ac-2527]